MPDQILQTLRAALYARVSSEEQREGQTIDSQIAELERFATDKGWLITGIYKDDGWSGTLLARPQLDSLRDAGTKKQFDVVVFNDVDRLARDVAHLSIIKRDFERHGIQVIFRKLPTESSPTSNLMINILGSFAEFERELILDRTRRGRKHKIEVRKEYIGSNAAYGYCYIPKDRGRGSNGLLEIVSEEARIVKLMYEWVDKEGLSIRQVCKRLNEQQVPSRKRRPWAKSSTARVLRSEMYTGVWYYYKQQACEPIRPVNKNKYRHPKSSNRQRPRSEWAPIYLPDDLILIDRAQWERVQKQITKNRVFSPRNAKHSYLLGGLLRCGGCGATYSGDTNKDNKGRPVFLYRCAKRCKAYPMISENKLDPLIWVAVEQAILNPAIIENQIAGLKNRNTIERQDTKNKAKLIQDTIQKIKEEETRVIEAYRLQIISAEQLKKELDNLTTRLSNTETERSNCNADEVSPDIFRKSITDFCNDAALGIKLFTIGERQKFLRLILEKIIFRGKEVIIKGIIPIKDEFDNTGIASTAIGSNGHKPDTDNLVASAGIASTVLRSNGHKPDTDNLVASAGIASTVLHRLGRNAGGGTNLFDGYRERNNNQCFQFDLIKSINKPASIRDHKEVLESYLTQNPAAKLRDLCKYLQEQTGMKARLSTMSRAVKKLGLPYTKRGNQGKLPKPVILGTNQLAA